MNSRRRRTLPSCRTTEAAQYSTTSSSNAEGPCERIVTWHRLECCTNVQRTASEKACNRWMTFKVIQGHCRCCHLIGLYDFLLVFHCKYICVLHRFRDINTYLPKSKISRDLDHVHLGESLSLRDKHFSGQPVHKIWLFYLQPFQRSHILGLRYLLKQYSTSSAHNHHKSWHCIPFAKPSISCLPYFLYHPYITHF